MEWDMGKEWKHILSDKRVHANDLWYDFKVNLIHVLFLLYSNYISSISFLVCWMKQKYFKPMADVGWCDF